MAESQTLNSLSQDIARSARDVAPAAVRIFLERSALNGFLFDKDLIVAPSERIEGARGDSFVVETQAGRQEAQLIGRDPATDIALLRLSNPLSASPLNTAAAGVQIGQMVIMVGRARHGAACTLGMISVAGEAWESLRGGKIDGRIEIDARLPRGLEGAAVIDGSAGLVGMAVFGRRRRVLAIPTATIARVVPELAEHGRIRHGYLGVGVHSVHVTDTEPAQTGLIVLGLDQGGPARVAGVLQGDIIVGVAGHSVGSPRQLHRVLSGETIGTKLGLDIIRSGVRQMVEVEVGAAPQRA